MAINRIVYAASYSHCEARGSVRVPHLSPYLHPVMSTTSIATVSAVHDPTLGNAHDLANCICILVTTKGDGTLFSPNSFQEEDLVELCVGLGQAYLDGVFWILETKPLLTFHSTTEMMATTCLLGAAMAWHSEPIRLHTHPPTTSHLRVYVAERNACPYSTQTPTPGREVVSQLPPSNPHLKERPPPPFQMALRDPGDAQLRQLMEDLWQEAAHRELTMFPIGPTLGHWKAPASGVDANLEDEEVTLWGEGMGTQ